MELSKCSRSYISQVKNGKRPPSQKLLTILEKRIQYEKPIPDYYDKFMRSRLAKEVSPSTLRFYEVKLGRFLPEIDPDKAKQPDIEKFLLQFPDPGNRHGYFQVIKIFYTWKEQTYELKNPVKHMLALRVGRLILPSLTREQVSLLLEEVQNARDKAIIALFTESGLRLSELINIKARDIDWNGRTI